MTDSKTEYETMIRELLEEIYTRKRETGKISKEVQAYAKGFSDAGLSFHKDMAAAEKADQDLFDEPGVPCRGDAVPPPDPDAAHLVSDGQKPSVMLRYPCTGNSFNSMEKM